MIKRCQRCEAWNKDTRRECRKCNLRLSRPELPRTPETDAAEFPVMTWPSRDNPLVVRSTLARKLEADRNHWRNEHDRILREYQHRLTVLATSAIEATSYPEEEAGPSADPDQQPVSPTP